MATFIKAMVGGKLLDEQMQKIRMDNIQPINPAKALVLVKAIRPVLYGSGAIPGDPGTPPSTTAASGSTATTTPG